MAAKSDILQGGGEITAARGGSWHSGAKTAAKAWHPEGRIGHSKARWRPEDRTGRGEPPGGRRRGGEAAAPPPNPPAKPKGAGAVPCGLMVFLPIDVTVFDFYSLAVIVG